MTHLMQEHPAPVVDRPFGEEGAEGDHAHGDQQGMLPQRGRANVPRPRARRRVVSGVGGRPQQRSGPEREQAGGGDEMRQRIDTQRRGGRPQSGAGQHADAVDAVQA